MGLLFSSILKRGGLEVTLVDHRAGRANFINTPGIQVRGVRGIHSVPVPVTVDSSSLGKVDLVIFCVKAFDTLPAIKQHKKLFGKNTLVWTIQNGWGNIENLSKVVSPTQIIGGSTTMGAYTEGDGHVYHSAEGDTYMGLLEKQSTSDLKTLATILTTAGLKTTNHEDIRKLIWTKLLINVGINALTAVLRIKNGDLVKHQESKTLSALAVKEALVAAHKNGQVFDEDQILTKVQEVAEKTAANRSSMLADILSRRHTEIDYINGAIAKMTEAPVNQMLTDLIKTLEATYKVRQG